MDNTMPRRPLVAKAIQNKTLIQVDYERHSVKVEPHIYGVDDQGGELLYGWVVAGGSARWTTEMLDEARIVQPITEHFAGPRPGYSRENPRFAQIFAVL
jgi:hypothetical protein